MSFDFSEIQRQMEELNGKLQAIKAFAEKVAETKRLADTLAENFARMKSEITQTINKSFAEIADQIEELRKNMEQMESVQVAPDTGDTTSVSEPKKKPEITPKVESEPVPKEPEKVPEKEPEPTPKEPEPEEPEKVPEKEPESTPKEPEPIPKEPEPEGDAQKQFLEQQRDKLKAQLTDLRFDYMRGYIPEEEYKAKESELDSELAELEKRLSTL
ncbi:MAG: hypothetical protein GF411_10200 [Candidatus Lokiarchaeota archaeon]|nr:hypothetical protein [Candidatus Lokiarchaeota archaeon]